MTFAGRARVPGVPDAASEPLKPYEAAVLAARETRPFVRVVRARRRGRGHPDARAGAGRRARGRAASRR